MAWKSLLAAALSLGLAEALQTKATVRELQASAQRAAAKELNYHSAVSRRSNVVADTDPSLLYPAYNLSVPIDHFHNDSIYEPHTNASFNLRYWFDASHYQEGGPVIVLQSGEDTGVDRLPYLQKGIVSILANATGGLGVILEHRYYGTSFPLPDLSTESLRFLTTDQALADMAYFAKHVQFEGLDEYDLSPSNVPYIAYGGSYAGAFVAFLRKLYPDIYWGAISSSGVTEAIYDFWQYYEAAQLFAPGDCATNTQKLTNVVDNILIGKNGTDYVQQLKDVFGLGNITRSDDFANAISYGISYLQNTNWDPAENDTTFGTYCDAVSSTTLQYNNTASKQSQVVSLLEAAGYGNQTASLTGPFLNYIGFVADEDVTPCAQEGLTQDQCFTNYNTTYYELDDISQTWRSWPYQYCFEWGYLQTGSGVPKDQLPLISRLIDLNMTSAVCKEAFNITTPSQVERINKWGGFNISYPRLAIIGGQHDPWRQATPLALGLPNRTSTTDEPVHLIPAAVHHWDENGLFPNQTTASLPPATIKDVQALEVQFVQAWVAEWEHEKANKMKSIKMHELVNQENGYGSLEL